jgi:hypothetical protein
MRSNQMRSRGFETGAVESGSMASRAGRGRGGPAPPVLLRPWRDGPLAVALALAALTPRPAAGADLVCRAVDGIAQLLTPATIVLVGEIHGTEESPAFVADLTCSALAAERSVTVALEIPQEEGARIDAFLASPGGAEDRAALLGGAFWRDPFQDGRRSRAEAGLLDELRRHRRAGRPLRVTLLDQVEQPSGGERDARMAARLEAAAKAAPNDLVIALTGNLHSRTTVGTPFDAGRENMGYLVARALPESKVLGLDVASTAGSAWICGTPDPASCGIHQVPNRGQGEGLRVRLQEHANKDGYQGSYAVGPLTASPPAVPRAVDTPRGPA